MVVLFLPGLTSVCDFPFRLDETGAYLDLDIGDGDARLLETISRLFQ